MLKKEDYDRLKTRSAAYFEKAHIAITPVELEKFQVAEYNLGKSDRSHVVL